MAWNNELILEFLELYKEEEVIWNPKNPFNRHRVQVNEAWTRIQSALPEHFSISDLKKKKESLMTSFRMHYNRKRKNPDGYRPVWFAYDSMESFLGLKYLDSDIGESTSDLKQESFNSSPYDTSENDHHYSGRNSHANERQTKHHPKLSASKINRDNKSYSDYIHTNTANNTSDLINVKKQMDEAVTYLKSAAGSKREMDEIDLYGQLLVKKLRKLDEHQLDITMHEIDNAVFRAMMRSSSKPQRSFSTSPVPRKVKSPLFIVAQSQSLETQQYVGENVEVYEEDDPIQMPSAP